MLTSTGSWLSPHYQVRAIPLALSCFTYRRTSFLNQTLTFHLYDTICKLLLTSVRSRTGIYQGGPVHWPVQLAGVLCSNTTLPWHGNWSFSHHVSFTPSQFSSFSPHEVVFSPCYLVVIFSPNICALMVCVNRKDNMMGVRRSSPGENFWNLQLPSEQKKMQPPL